MHGIGLHNQKMTVRLYRPTYVVLRKKKSWIIQTAVWINNVRVKNYFMEHSISTCYALYILTNKLAMTFLEENILFKNISDLYLYYRGLLSSLHIFDICVWLKRVCVSTWKGCVSTCVCPLVDLSNKIWPHLPTKGTSHNMVRLSA